MQLSPSLFRLFFLFMAFFLSANAASKSDYLGAQACTSCHQKQAQLWRESDHYRAMAPASRTSVLAPFGGEKVEFHGFSSRFFQDNNKFLIETLNQSGERETFSVLHTFGHFPLQQYLLDIGNGRLQAFDIAWDSRSEKKGGQRWFHLQPDEDISPEHPFFWTGHFQNWNTSCADCHSTGLEKNYRAQDHGFDTQWSDINVACEACHGPGKQHIASMQKGNFQASDLWHTGSKTTFIFEQGKPIATPLGTSDSGEIDRCGGCHSRRSLIADGEDKTEFHERFQLQLLNENLYHNDGQIEDEVFVLGSFLQSKMYTAGVRCSHCHDPHSGKTVLPTEQLCSQCHRSDHYDNKRHSGHTEQSVSCVDCHMPETVYMGVDPRRDHRFGVPNPMLSERIGSPDACSQCHAGEDSAQLLTIFEQNRGRPMNPVHNDHWALLRQRVQRGESTVTGKLYDVIMNDQYAPILQATLLSELQSAPSQLSVTMARKQLQHRDPLMRRAAINALSVLPPEQLFQLISPMTEDTSKVVRLQAATNLSQIYAALSKDQRTIIEEAIGEHRRALSTSLEHPANRVTLALLEFNTGNVASSEKHYQAALALSPTFLPALLNYADFLRASQRDKESEMLLLKAVSVAPDAAATQHALGLYWIRQGNTEEAMTHLKTAAELENASARHAYVYSVALESSGELKQAVRVLETALERWPDDRTLMFTLIGYLDKSNQGERLKSWLARAEQLAPDARETQYYRQKYAN